jgi:hypothetical protein
MLDHVCRPAIDGLPILAARLIKDALTVNADNIVKAILSIEILRRSKEGDDIRLIWRKVDILHAPLPDHFIYELDRSAVSSFKFDNRTHTFGY